MYDIMLEDWFLLIKIFFMDNEDLSIEWQSAKQGFELLILDGIYNDGMLTTLHTNMNKKVKRFFSEFDNIFTLNYDNNIDELLGRKVFHLHGDYCVPPDSENPDTVMGALRIEKGENISIPDDFKHCYCNALLDYYDVFNRLNNYGIFNSI